MGIEETVEKMDPKLKKLFINVISVMMILTILLGVLSAMMAYLDSGNFFSILNANILVPVILPLLFLWMAYSILTGRKINTPNQFSSKGKKVQFNIPDTYGVRGKLNKEPVQQPQQQQQSQIMTGTWTCPKCNYLAKGIKCNKCGFVRKQ